MSGQSVFLRAMRAKNTMRGSERELFKKGVPFLKSSKREYHADDGACEDEEDRVQALRGLAPARQHEQNGRERHALPVDERQPDRTGIHQCERRHGNARRRDHRRRRGAQAVKYRVHELAVAEALEKRRDDQNDDDRRCDKADRRDERTGNASGDEADIGRHIHTERAGGRLGNGHHVRQLRRCEPLGVPSGHVVEKRERRKAAAHGEQTRLEELIKQQQICHFFAPPAFRLWIRTPASAAATT